MKWRVMLVGPDGNVGVHEVGGCAAVAEYAPQMIGLTLEEGKHLLAALQVNLVPAQAEDHCRGMMLSVISPACSSALEVRVAT